MKPGAPQIIACRIYCPAAIILLFVMSSQLAGCSAWKDRAVNKADSVVLRKEHNIAEVIIKHKQTEVLHSAHSDSLKSSCWIMIIPDGEFTYSPEKGFTGKASSLQIQANKENWHSAVTSAEKVSTLALDSTSNRSLQSKQRTQTKATEKAPDKTSILTIALAIILVVTLLFLSRKFVPSIPSKT